MTTPTSPLLPALEVVAWQYVSEDPLDGGQMMLSEEKPNRRVLWPLVRLSEAEEAINALRAEVAALRADGERYRWLRNEAHPDRDDTGLSVSEQDFNDWGNQFTRYFSGDALDAAIDAAINASREALQPGEKK